MKNVPLKISGREISLLKRTADKLKGLNMGEKLSFDFYDGVFRGASMLFVKPKGKNPTPNKCRIISERLFMLFQIPVVFMLSPGATYERQRLMEKEIYFVMSNKYANLPMLVAMEKVHSRKVPDKLTPVAQYMLLYHLQVGNIEGKSTKAVASLMPYSYESVSIGLTCLSDLGLCEKVPISKRSKAVRFKYSGKNLWEVAGEFFINPIERRVYCDGINSKKRFPIGGINALSHYSMLNPDQEQCIIMGSKEYRDLDNEGRVINPNEFDGDTIIEIWKYPVVSLLHASSEWADKLSLALSLKEDPDPRVEEEVEYMINRLQW